ncbi:MAG: dihydrofolate reductase [Desulfopila sp.]
MDVILIAAMATNRVIGRNKTIPWHIPEEMQFFKRTTMGYPVVMGRLTFESLPHPLPGRRNIVISRNPGYCTVGADNVTSLDQALKVAGEVEKIFILGGNQIFQEALPGADRIILTVLDREVEGDVYFPDFSDEEFQQTHHERYENAREPFTVYYYSRIPPAA